MFETYLKGFITIRYSFCDSASIRAITIYTVVGSLENVFRAHIRLNYYYCIIRSTWRGAKFDSLKFVINLQLRGQNRIHVDEFNRTTAFRRSEATIRFNEINKKKPVHGLRVGRPLIERRSYALRVWTVRMEIWTKRTVGNVTRRSTSVRAARAVAPQ